MFSIFKKKKDNKAQIKSSIEISENNTIQYETTQANIKYAKPSYTPQTRKSYYDDERMHIQVKENIFKNSSTVIDPYNGKVLVKTIKEAKDQFGSHWQEHLAESDHIDPLNQVVKRAEKNAWVTVDNIKDVANSQENFQIISRRTNQTGGKGGSTQTEWSQDRERMQFLAEDTKESVESLSQRIKQNGELAEKRNNAKLYSYGFENMIDTAHTAGKITAVNAGGTAAAISIINNIASFIKGEKSTSKILKDIAKDGSEAGISGYIKGSSLTVLNHTLSNSKSSFLAALGKNNVTGGVITTVSIVGNTVVKWGNNEISTEECLIELGNKGCSFGGASFGAAIGQTVIPIPIIGGVIGSLVGGTLISNVYECIVNELQFIQEEERRKQEEVQQMLMQYYAEQARREEVQQLIRVNTEDAFITSMQSIIQSDIFKRMITDFSSYFQNRFKSETMIAESVLVALQLQEYNYQLQEYSKNYFGNYSYCFDSALELMDSALRMGNYNNAIIGTNQVTQLFGKSPIIKDTDDFKNKIFGNGNILF